LRGRNYKQKEILLKQPTIFFVFLLKKKCIHACDEWRNFRGGGFVFPYLESKVEDGENDAVNDQNAIQNVADMHVLHGVCTDTT